ncbi:PREDICTED: nose resistant to fluoxetine protein 6-like [Papilio polytes]|uniref:nose resistant to fluoxetine protein 6-like n=1 Tax=Papilio polytes TaxID=76194 RepID=UPI000675C7BC|nr:PREDICTED: nose resistant to fluoxetine protein 6-like [Papilio polytes]
MLKTLFLSVLLYVSTDAWPLTVGEAINSLFDQLLYQSVLDPELCKKQIRYMALNNTRLLAEFLDAGVRIPRGLFDDNSVDFGNYHQCLGIDSPFEQSRISGKYCVIQIPLLQNFTMPGFSGDNSTLENDLIKLGPSGEMLLDKYYSIVNMYRLIFGTNIYNRTSPICGAVLQMAACVPRTCTTDDAISALLFNTSAYGFDYAEEYCRLPNDKPWVTVDSVALVIFCSIGVLTALSTLYEMICIFLLKRSSNTCFRMFSVYSNTKSLLRGNLTEGNIKCLEGIKTVAMIWTVIGHSINSVSYLQNPTYYFGWTLSADSALLSSVPINADTFFMMGGLLLVYNCAKKMDGTMLIKNLHLFYLTRHLRMLPLLAISILLDASVFHKLADSPLYISSATAVNAIRCRAYWWSTLINLQNYVNPKEMCVPHSWYVAVDIQLHILSPVVLYWVLSGNRQTAWSALMIAFAVGLAISAIYNFIMLLPAHTIIPARNSELLDYFELYYFHIISRITSFLVGMVFGYILHIWRGKKVVIYKRTVLTLWATSFGIMLGTVYILYRVKQQTWNHVYVDATINTLMRPLWSAAVGWLVLACAHGYGGPIDWFLSLPMWQLPGRMCYGLYLFHYPIIFVVNDVSVSPQYFTFGRILFQSIASMVLTFTSSFIFTVLIDEPFRTLFKIILDKGEIKCCCQLFLRGQRKRRKKHIEELELLKHTE